MSNSSEQALNVIETHLGDLSEDMAINLHHTLARQFGWAGTFFTRDDVAASIAESRAADKKEPLSDDELDEAISTIVGSRDWLRWLPDYLLEKGLEIIDTAIYNHLEQEDN